MTFLFELHQNEKGFFIVWLKLIKMFGLLFNFEVASQGFSKGSSFTAYKLQFWLSQYFVHYYGSLPEVETSRALNVSQHVQARLSHFATIKSFCYDSDDSRTLLKLWEQRQNALRIHLSLFTSGMCERCLCRSVGNGTDSFAHVDQNKAICLEWLMSLNLLGAANPTDECSEI